MDDGVKNSPNESSTETPPEHGVKSTNASESTHIKTAKTTPDKGDDNDHIQYELGL